MTWTPSMEIELRVRLKHAVMGDAERRDQEQRRASMCEGKLRFASRKEAAENMPKRKIHGRTEPYKCQFCNGYHVGTHISTAAHERRPRGDDGVMVCRCGCQFEATLGKYGCPNCEGDSGPARRLP